VSRSIERAGALIVGELHPPPSFRSPSARRRPEWAAIERIQEKWGPIFRPNARQNKDGERIQEKHAPAKAGVGTGFPGNILIVHIEIRDRSVIRRHADLGFLVSIEQLNFVNGRFRSRF